MGDSIRCPYCRCRFTFVLNLYLATGEQAAVIDAAVRRLRELESDPDISVGRALELIAADYLSGV